MNDGAARVTEGKIMMERINAANIWRRIEVPLTLERSSSRRS